jgi:hypothetical protein
MVFRVRRVTEEIREIPPVKFRGVYCYIYIFIKSVNLSV